MSFIASTNKSSAGRRAFRALGGVLLVAIIGSVALRSSADDSDKASKKESHHHPFATEKTKGETTCPMMAGLSGLKLFADSPAALLARAEELGLDIKQQRQLEEIEEAARLQARKLLNDKQWQQVRHAPPGRLSMMEMASMGMKDNKMEGCCPMCMKMMQAKDSKGGDQAHQVLDMVHKGFQAYQDSKGDREQRHPAKSDIEKLQGTWRVVSSQVGDEKASADEVKKRKVTVKGDFLIYEYGNEQKEKQEGTIKLDPHTKAFDWIWLPTKVPTMLGIYELKGDDLRIGFGNDGLVRPRQFVIGKDDVVWLLVLKRESPQKDVPKK